MSTDKTLPVVAWLRGVCSPNTPMGSAEYDEECSPGDDRPLGEGWIALSSHDVASARIAELERQRQELKGNSHAVLNALSHDARELEAQVRDLTADRDSWADQCSQRAADWDEMRKRAESAEAQVQELRAAFGKHVRVRASWQEQALRAFARDVLADWPDAAPDGFELQDLAVRHGLLRLADPKPHQPCGEDCSCASHLHSNEWDGGIDCYRRTPLLLGDAAIAEEKGQ